jgi:hypothetical protein
MHVLPETVRLMLVSLTLLTWAQTAIAQSDAKTVLKPVIVEIVQLRKESDAERTRIAPVWNLLFSPGSIESNDVAKRIIKALHEQLDLDSRMAIATEDWALRAQSRIKNSTLSESSKTALINALTSRPELFQSRQDALRIERAWVTATEDFYLFVIQNRSRINVSGGVVRIKHALTLKRYNGKLQLAKSKWSELIKAVQTQQELQAAIERESGTPLAELMKIYDSK